MNTLEFLAKNIKCMGCVNNIKTGLSEMNGIENVDVDLESGKVSVSGSGLSKPGIEDKLKVLGYPVS